jgi:hypothetical protein
MHMQMQNPAAGWPRENPAALLDSSPAAELETGEYVATGAIVTDPLSCSPLMQATGGSVREHLEISRKHLMVVGDEAAAWPGGSMRSSARACSRP